MTTPETDTPSPGPTTRLYHAFGPVVGALVLDAADFVTFGPIGIYVGVLVGGGIGWWLSSFYAFDSRSRWAIAALAAIYTAVPMTEFVPLATIVSAFARYRAPHTARQPDSVRKPDDIEVGEPR